MKIEPSSFPKLVSPSSVLATVPAQLNDIQRGWLEGIRYSLEICDLSYRRLCATLLEIAHQESAAFDVERGIAALTDAWTFVDSTWRLKRLLLDRFIPFPPGPLPLTQQSPANNIGLADFRTSVRNVKNVRDSFQHIDDHVDQNRVKDKLVWGHITWYVPRIDQQRIDVFTVISGTMPRASMAFDPIDTRGGRYRRPIDRISLTAYNERVDLTPIYESYKGIVQALEALIGRQIKAERTESSGVLMKAELYPEVMTEVQATERDDDSLV